MGATLIDAREGEAGKWRMTWTPIFCRVLQLRDILHCSHGRTFQSLLTSSYCLLTYIHTSTDALFISLASSHANVVCSPVSQTRIITSTVQPIELIPKPNSTPVYAGRSRCLATASTAASSSTPPPPPATSSDPRISKIVDDISGLTLLQAADLVALLKVCLLSILVE